MRTTSAPNALRLAGDEVELIEPQPGGHRSHIDPRSSSWRATTEWLGAKVKTVPGTVFRKRSTSRRGGR